MKKSSIQELKNKPAAELSKLLVENMERMRQLRLDLVAGKVKNVGELRETRKKIARIKTFIQRTND